MGNSLSLTGHEPPEDRTTKVFVGDGKGGWTEAGSASSISITTTSGAIMTKGVLCPGCGEPSDAHHKDDCVLHPPFGATFSRERTPRELDSTTSSDQIQVRKSLLIHLIRAAGGKVTFDGYDLLEDVSHIEVQIWMRKDPLLYTIELKGDD